MKIRILCVGKLKEKYLVDGIKEYSKRLSGYCDFEIIEVNDEKTPANASEKDEENIKNKESERLLSKIKDQDYVILLDVNSKEYDSITFSKEIEKVMVNGKSTIDFIIGGSLGHGKAMYKRADMKVSFSKMTFPHQLMRLILIEQIYRAFKIMKNETYHK